MNTCDYFELDDLSTFDDAVFDWHETPTIDSEDPEDSLPATISRIPRNPGEPILLSQIRPESEDNHIEYKLKLQPSPQRLQRLITQLNCRLFQGGGSCCYQIGVSDKGMLNGQPKAVIDKSVDVVRTMAKELGVYILSEQVYVALISTDDKTGWIEQEMAEALQTEDPYWKVKDPPDCLAEIWLSRSMSRCASPTLNDTPEIRVAVCGDAGAGKSSLITALSKGELTSKSLDSAVPHTQEPFQSEWACSLIGHSGFDSQQPSYDTFVDGITGEEDTPETEESTPSEISALPHTVLLLQGDTNDAKHFSTTLFDLCARFPDYAALIIPADRILDDSPRQGVFGLRPPDTDLEQLEASLALNTPAFVVITKSDLLTETECERALNVVASLVQRFGKSARVIEPCEDFDSIVDFDATQWLVCPVFVVSNATGAGIAGLRRFLFQLINTPRAMSSLELLSSSHSHEQLVDFAVSSSRQIGETVELTVDGVLVTGCVFVGQRLFVGPAAGEYHPCVVLNIEARAGSSTNFVSAPKSCSLAIQMDCEPVFVRRGMAVTSSPDAACFEFMAVVHLFKYGTTPLCPLVPRQQVMVHSGAVHQVAQIVSIESGDPTSVVSNHKVWFRFGRPEHVRPNSRLLFR
eukprot:c18350_g1_i3.p1 GENE.c18350_g1_i3~~c18350_g1_i3.p1  ORF type:complete len:672 (+),score=134.06 c18350_g1_i3:116-2017(+)